MRKPAERKDNPGIAILPLIKFVTPIGKVVLTEVVVPKVSESIKRVLKI